VKIKKPALWIAIPYVAVAVLLVALFRDHMTLCCGLCTTIAELAASYICIRTASKAHDDARILWRMLGVSILIGSTAVDLLIWSQLHAAVSADPSQGLILLTEMLFWAALLLTVSLQFDFRIPRALRGMSAFLSISIGILCFVFILSRFSNLGPHQIADLDLVPHLFTAIGVFLAVVASLRLLGTDRLEERQFFFVASAFLWTMTLTHVIRDQFLTAYNLRWIDLLLPIPFLLLIFLASQEPPGFVQSWHPSVRVSSIMRSAGTAFLSFGLLLLGTAVSRRHFWLGASAALLSVICYSVLNLISLSRGIEAEEALLAAKLKLEELAGLDGLTGIANRRTLDQRLEFEFQAARRSGQPVSLLMIDVDLFKSLNDSKGHLVGDSYLVQVAHALRNALSRTNDFVARYGGEEFVVLLPATGDAGAVRIAGRLHAAIAALDLDHPLSPTERLTISIGCTTADSLVHHSPNALIDAADRAMYLAKKLGRNRTEYLPLTRVVVDVENAS
jgi:diguanylate cyclase (GGDEF)-like protein